MVTPKETTILNAMCEVWEEIPDLELGLADVMTFVKKATGEGVSKPTVWRLFNRLEKNGYLFSEMRFIRNVGGKERRVYGLTQAGYEFLFGSGSNG